MKKQKTIAKSIESIDIKSLTDRYGSPLEYMLSVMADPKAGKTRRDKMALMSAPYCHAKIVAAVVDRRVSKRQEAEVVSMSAEVGTNWESLLAAPSNGH